MIPITSTYCLVYYYWCIIAWYNFIGKTIVAQTVKYLPAMQEPQVRSLGQEDPLEKGMANHSSILAWRIPIGRGAWWATVHRVVKSRT